MTNLRVPGLLLLATWSLAACAAFGGGGPSPSGGGGPAVTTPEQAVAAVVAANPRFAAIMARDPELIGQAHWYEVQEASGVGAYLVTMRVGWGDCPSGCIDEHLWQFAVAPDGAVTLQSERGPAVPDDAWPPAGQGGTGIAVVAVAGPVCPVETEPPDPACAPRPVADAIVHVRDAGGTEIASATLDATGSAFIATPAGAFVLVADPVEGLMGTPAPQDVVVGDGVATAVTLAYDTGIR